MVEHMDMSEEPVKALTDKIIIYTFLPYVNLLNCFHSIFTPFDTTYEKIGDILHQFGSFS